MQADFMRSGRAPEPVGYAEANLQIPVSSELQACIDESKIGDAVGSEILRRDAQRTVRIGRRDSASDGRKIETHRTSRPPLRDRSGNSAFDI